MKRGWWLVVVMAPAIVAIFYVAMTGRSAVKVRSEEKPEDVAVAISSTTTEQEKTESPKVSTSPPTPPPIAELTKPKGGNRAEKSNGAGSISAPKLPADEFVEQAPTRSELNSGGGSPAGGAIAGESTAVDRPAEGEPGPRKHLRREGTQIVHVVGTISKRGSQLHFQPEDGSSGLLLLENQLLERIEGYELARSREGRPSRWTLSGRVTEYRGSNYLLLTGATLAEGAPTP